MTEKIQINDSNWHWSKPSSSYNHNYYFDTTAKGSGWFLEECDDDVGDCLYYECNTKLEKIKYLGYTNREGSHLHHTGECLELDPDMPRTRAYGVHGYPNFRWHQGNV